MKKPKKTIAKKQKKEAFTTLLLIVMAIGGTFAFIGILKVSLKTENPLVVVISDSMEPTIDIGDMLVIQGKNPAEIENGTIILYDSRDLWPNFYVPEPIVHRVVERYYNNSDEKWYFITLGDNNDDTDPPDGPFGDEIPVPEDRVIGTVKLIIPKIGKIKMMLDEANDEVPGLTTIILFGLSILLILSIMWDLTHPEEKEDKNLIKQKELEDKKNVTPLERSEVDLGI
ncbi:signal peptidase I [Promethearchaeum syntrophicum]|uniref:Signal peptidase I n=1 Tax=Promethearchaeum syntrophicum TaxID=2594042 RepID=A0A5B9DCP5_9ARCH|nr:signal peptidase I [Candidatus Prometheoarchaeum syntrophicum]QEE16530.1 hypothetical protein DSAG12_02360 [Candidatus Prometheoarchaeum syntrophicum]